MNFVVVGFQLVKGQPLLTLNVITLKMALPFGNLELFEKHKLIDDIISDCINQMMTLSIFGLTNR
jgi:hypothetical protein